jgi:hypothetical protein
MLALVLASCARDGGALVGVSPPRAAGRTGKGVPRATLGKDSPLPADFREKMTRLVPRQLSRGHAERFDAIVWGNEVASAAWNASGEMPEGAQLVEEAIGRDPSGAGDDPLGFLLMEKSSGKWRFIAIEADGTSPASPGRGQDLGPDLVEGAATERCAACHAEAPRDFVFQALSTSTTSAAPRMAIVPNAVASTAATSEARSAGSAGFPSSR